MPTADYSSYHQANGTTSDGAKFDNFIDAVQATVNGLDNNNIAASAGIVASKLSIPYAAYTPAWTSSGVAPALGNGTITGSFVQIGKFVHFLLKLSPGSTTTFGTGSYSFSLPVSADLTFQGGPIGAVYSQDVSAGNFAQSLPILATATTFNIQHIATWPTGTQIIYAQTLPWTWATGDLLLATGVYQAA